MCKIGPCSNISISLWPASCREADLVWSFRHFDMSAGSKEEDLTRSRILWDNFHLDRLLSSTTRFQLILPVHSQNVTENRTDHKMHVEGIQICQINRWNNSFQNIYGMNRQKLTDRCCAKKHLIFAFFGGHESDLPDFGRTWTQNHWHQVNFWDSP